MNEDREYVVCRELSVYLRYKHPQVLFHFDYAGMYHTKTQAGKMKAIQGKKGFPDLFIIEPRGKYHGLFLEIKKEGTTVFNTLQRPANDHLKEQHDYLCALQSRGYWATFAVGLDQCIEVVEIYLNMK